jgi:hypothetical protein
MKFIKLMLALVLSFFVINTAYTCYNDYSKKLSIPPLIPIEDWPEDAKIIIDNYNLDSNHNGFIDTDKELMFTARKLAEKEMGDYESYSKEAIRTPTISANYLSTVSNPQFNLVDFGIYTTRITNENFIATTINNNKGIKINFSEQKENMGFVNFEICTITIPEHAQRMRVTILKNTMSHLPNFFSIYLNFDKKRPTPPYDWSESYTYTNYFLNGEMKEGVYMSFWIPKESIESRVLKLSAAFADISSLKTGSEISFSISFSK